MTLIATTRRRLQQGISGLKLGVLKAGLSLMHGSGLGHLLETHTRGRGIIFTLHSVSPATPSQFDPNGILRVTPQFLEQTILTTRGAGYDIVSLDEAARRIASPVPQRPFACFTFDDGYRDNRDYAYPILKRHGAPFAIYVPTAYPDGGGDLWWLVLENAIRKTERVTVWLAGRGQTFATASPSEKTAAYERIYWQLRALPEREMRDTVRWVAADVGYDPSRLCADEIMTWDEIRALAHDPLVTIGAHTHNHLALAKLPAREAEAEIKASVARIEAELGRPCRHFSFPYGDAESAAERDFEMVRALGLSTGVTTRKGVIGDAHQGAMTGLPRVSLNGNFQKTRYVRLFLTGLPFALISAAKSRRRDHAMAPGVPALQVQG